MSKRVPYVHKDFEIEFQIHETRRDENLKDNGQDGLVDQ